jgi:prepilin-type N-terminal cleavage/methylation domain-containing protein/prepilin-type processing-associated H-X9-DG protein
MKPAAQRRTKPRAGMTLLELMIVITAVCVAAALVLPAVGAGWNMARRWTCSGNMRELSMAFRLFADINNGDYPPGAPNGWLTSTQGDLLTRNNFICDADALYPDYVSSLDVFSCPSSPVATAGGEAPWFMDMSFHPERLDPFVALDPRNAGKLASYRPLRPDPDCVTCQSYVYMPYAVADHDDAVLLWDEMFFRMAQGETGFLDEGLALSGERTGAPSRRFLRMDVDAARLLAADPLGPGAAASEARVPVLYDAPAPNGVVELAHLAPPGGNVLYLDGHVEFRRYPDPLNRIPYSFDYVEWTRVNVYDNRPLTNVPPWCSNRPDAPDFRPRFQFHPDGARYQGLYF